jgi:hypothetical protein
MMRPTKKPPKIACTPSASVAHAEASTMTKVRAKRRDWSVCEPVSSTLSHTDTETSREGSVRGGGQHWAELGGV